MFEGLKAFRGPDGHVSPPDLFSAPIWVKLNNLRRPGAHLPPVRPEQAVRQDDESPLENRLGHSPGSGTMGEPAHGLGELVSSFYYLPRTAQETVMLTL